MALTAQPRVIPIDEFTNLQKVEGIRESLEVDYPPIEYSPQLYEVYEYSQEEIVDWARRYCKIPWTHMVEAGRKILAGETLSQDEATVQIALTPFRVDYRAAFHLLRDTLGLLVFDPANLFTIILDSRGQKILKAYFENTRFNNYVELVDIDPSEPWLQPVETWIREGQWEKLRPFLARKMQEKYHQPVNWVKIANLNFFCAFKEVWDRYETTNNLGDYLIGAFQAIQKIYLHQWIKFTPTPPLFARLEELMTKILDIRIEDFAAYPGQPPSLAIPDQTGERLIIGLRSDDYAVAIDLGGPNCKELLLSFDITRGCQHMSLPALAKYLGRQAKARYALTVDYRAVRAILYDLANRPLPRNNLAVSETSFYDILRLARNYRRQWAIWPVPLPLKGWVTLVAKLLGVPYGIHRLSHWFLPRFTHRTLPILMGYHTQNAIFLLDHDRPSAAVVIDLLNSGLKRVVSYPAHELQSAFKGMSESLDDIKEYLHRARFQMWDRVGWINYSVGIQKQLIEELLALVLGGEANSVLRVFRLWNRTRRLWQLLKRGALALYPDFLLARLWQWAKKEGLYTAAMAVLQIAFDTKQSRGYLFMGTLLKGIVAAAVIAGLIIGLVWWL